MTLTVNRDRELALLASTVGCGNPILVELRGGPATGKTSLLSELSELAELQGMVREAGTLPRMLGSLVGGAAEHGGLLLTFDDLHLADDPFCELLGQVLRNPLPGQAIFAAAYSPDQASPALLAALDGTRTTRLVLELDGSYAQAR